MEILAEALQETRRLILAGAALAPGDFRIKKLLPALEESAQSAPVMGRIAGTLKKACAESGTSVEEAADALMEAHTLISAVAATQAQALVLGDFTPISAANLGSSLGVSYSRGFAAVQALTTTGSGRIHVLEKARDEGVLKDIRLLPALLEGLGDGYPEVAELAEKALTAWGKEGLLALKNGFDANGNSAHFRRFQLLVSVGAFSEEELRHLALGDNQEVSVGIRTGAIKTLGDKIKDEDFFLVLVTDRKKDVRIAAASVLARYDSPKAVSAVVDEVVKDPDSGLIRAVNQSSSKALAALLLERVQADLEKAKAELLLPKPDKKVIAQAVQSLQPLPIENGSPSLKYLAEVLEALDKIKHSTPLEEVAAPLLRRLLDAGKDSRKVLLNASLTKRAPWLGFALFASIKNENLGAVYDRFSPLLRRDKKDPDTACLITAWKGLLESSSVPLVGWPGIPQETFYDLRWRDDFCRLDEPELVCFFESDNLPGSIEKYLISKAEKPGENPDAMESVLSALAKADCPKALDLIIQCWLESLMVKGNKRWTMHWAAEQALEDFPKKRYKDLIKRSEAESAPDLKTLLFEAAQVLAAK